MDNKKIVKSYLRKYFKSQYIDESDQEFKSLVRILNKKDREQLPNMPSEEEAYEIAKQAKKYCMLTQGDYPFITTKGVQKIISIWLNQSIK